MLDFVEEALDEVAFAIEHEVALAGRLPVGSGRNDRGDGSLLEGVDQGIGIIGLVADQGPWVGVLQQRGCPGQVVVLPRCQPQVGRIAQGIDKGMDLGAQSPAGAPDRLRAVFFTAPALCW